MSQIVIIGIVVSIILGATGFIASNNIIVGCLCLILPLLYFLVLGNRYIKKHEVKINRFRECYHFINNFIVSLSIKNSVSAAYETTIGNMSEAFKSGLENLETFSTKEKLEHLSRYFKFHVYSLFVDLISLYEEQGGNILEMSKYLLEELRQVDEYIFASENIARKKIVEFAILWILTLVIMITMRFALSQFFSTISKQIFFPLGIGAIIFFAVISIHVAISKMCKLKIKGWNDAEKI